MRWKRVDSYTATFQGNGMILVLIRLGLSIDASIPLVFTYINDGYK